VTGNAKQFGSVVSSDPQRLLRGIRRGIEKEGLRVQADTAMLSQTAHPTALGSALTHGAITTDYSEALLEFITPASEQVRAPLDTLKALHQYTARHLENEIVWTASMPCIVTGERGIPIARYGSSNVATMKRVYRNGLSARYGRMMQAIAGIHYNFSLPEVFWEQAWDDAGRPDSLQIFKTEGYLGLIRNFWHQVWLLIYLLGASPAVCASFLAGNRNHHLQPFDAMGNTLHLPYATSLRMGDLGYNSDAQKSMSICYNKLDTYIETLRSAIVTSHPGYADFPLTDEGELPQLNDSLLQIENEFYSPIRPKRVTRSGEAPLLALQRGGIEYVEVRCVDINPFLPLGIDEQTMHLIDCFLLACLTTESPACDEADKARDKENLRRVVDQGRDPALTLLDNSGAERPLAELAGQLLEQMAQAAEWLDAAQGCTGNRDAIAMARGRIDDPESTPSGRVLAEMRETGAAFWQIAQKYSRQWHQQFLNEPLDTHLEAELAQEALDSLQRQQEIEAADNIDFETYLAHFYAQYQRL
jgi:glutamate--cysteine ligase